MTEAASVGEPEPKAPAAAILGVPRNPVTRYRRQVVAAIAVAVLVIFAIALVIGLRPSKPVSKVPGDPDKTATPGASLAGPNFGTLAKSYGDPNGPIGQAPPATSLPASETTPPTVSTASPVRAPALSPEAQQAIDMARTARTASPFFSQGSDGGPAATQAPVTAPPAAFAALPEPGAAAAALSVPVAGGSEQAGAAGASESCRPAPCRTCRTSSAPSSPELARRPTTSPTPTSTRSRRSR